MGQEGRRRVREHFDVRRMQRRLEEIYLELVPGERDV
jgi:hypothetical protein